MQEMNTMVGQDIAWAAELLRLGEVVAIPTETVYGLAANAFDHYAVQKIYSAKGRPANNPLIVHISSASEMDEVAQDIPEVARNLAEAFWPGPLTLVLPKKAHIPAIVSAGLPTVGLRVPAHALTQRLLATLEFPLAAPSANPFGYISPTSASHVLRQLAGKIPYILDGGECSEGIESTIVGFEEGNAVIYRFGAIAPEAILEVVETLGHHTEDSQKPLAPGMLPYHYSPQTPLDLVDGLEAAIQAQEPEKRIAVLSLNSSFPQIPQALQFQLSPSGELREAARNLYKFLHKLDTLEIDLILAEKMPTEGLGLSINDRLKRAAAKR